MKTKNATQKTVTAALCTALVCIATMVVKIPSPLHGYVNLGDCMVLLSGWMLPPVYGFLAAGVGSALADLFSGFILYAPATFLIKGLMAWIACFGYRQIHRKCADFPARILSGIAAEIGMIFGYFLFEGFLYGFSSALINIPSNGVQGVAGLIFGYILIRFFEKSSILSSLRETSR